MISRMLCSFQVQTMDYSCIIFDTAPTGHTLRLLQFPSTLEKGLSKLSGLQGAMGGMMSQVRSSSMLLWRAVFACRQGHRQHCLIFLHG